MMIALYLISVMPTFKYQLSDTITDYGFKYNNFISKSIYLFSLTFIQNYWSINSKLSIHSSFLILILQYRLKNQYYLNFYPFTI
jgi:hypothetical protein